jgi:hypothetical protein
VILLLLEFYGRNGFRVLRFINEQYSGIIVWQSVLTMIIRLCSKGIVSFYRYCFCYACLLMKNQDTGLCVKKKADVTRGKYRRPTVDPPKVAGGAELLPEACGLLLLPPLIFFRRIELPCQECYHFSSKTSRFRGDDEPPPCGVSGRYGMKKTMILNCVFILVSLMCLVPEAFADQGKAGGWEAILPHNPGARFLKNDAFQDKRDINVTLIEVDMSKKNALGFYRDLLVQAGWRLDQALGAESETGSSDKPEIWGLLNVVKGNLSLTMVILSDQASGTTKTVIDITLLNHAPDTSIMTLMQNLPKVQVAADQTNVRFTQKEWAITVTSASNEGLSVSNRAPGYHPPLSITNHEYTLVRVKVRLERLDGKTIGIDFVTAKAYLADEAGNLYPIVGAACSGGDFWILIPDAVKNGTVSNLNRDDIDYVFAIPRFAQPVAFGTAVFAPINIRVINQRANDPQARADDAIVTKVLPSGSRYTGQMYQGRLHGKGSIIYKNGDRYEGDWRSDWITGYGTYTWVMGDKYEGQFIKGVKQGQGTYTWANGDQYIGRYQDDKLEGMGTYISASGYIHTGEWKAGKCNGHGVRTWKNGERYNGEWADNRECGYGEYTWPDGGRFVGLWRDNKRHGWGTWTKANGDVISGDWKGGVIHNATWVDKNGKKIGVYKNGVEEIFGEWKDNQKDGTGTYLWANGDIYVGECRNGVKTGRGVKTYANGDRYEGDWSRDKRAGQGTFVWTDGQRYEGAWVADRRTGKGIYTWPNGNRYEGEWKDNIRQGLALMTWSNGDRYEGRYQADKKTGKGVYTWANGNKYDGEWKDDERTGRGVYTWVNGDRAEGNWKNGKLDGRGVKTWADGTHYEGEWKDDKFDGQGTLKWKDGSCYSGGWKAGKQHGRGTLVMATGEKYVAEFKNGTLWNGTRYDKTGKKAAEYAEGKLKG